MNPLFVYDCNRRVGLNSSTMAGHPYAIVVDGNGAVSEHALGMEAPGTVLAPTLTLESTKTSDGRRVVVVSRPIAPTPTFRVSVAALRALDNARLPIIAAVGSSTAFSYHKFKGSSVMTLVNVGSSTCVCDGGDDAPFGKGTGFLDYVPPPGEPGSADHISYYYAIPPRL